MLTDRIGYTEYFLPTIEVKDFNVMIDGQNLNRWIKRQILLAMVTSKLMHSFRFEMFSALKTSVAL